jgi:hypothetical protein
VIAYSLCKATVLQGSFNLLIVLIADRCLAVAGLGIGQSRSPYSTILIAAQQRVVGFNE